jgi:cytochrome d ubiquinol oxidase subunit II
VGARAAGIGKIAALVFVLSFAVAGLWVWIGVDGQRIVSAIDSAGPSNPLLKTVEMARGAWLDNYHAHPGLWSFPVAAVLAALLGSQLLRGGRSGLALVASGVVQAATILTAGIALFPFLMPSSTNPGHSLTIWDASSSAKTLAIMLVAVVILLPMVLAYTAWVYRILRGQVTLEAIRNHVGLY